MNVSGVAAPGIPFIIVGATDHVAWGFTNTMADDSDYYLEKINPENENQYEYQGVWEDMTTREEVIKVKGGKDVKYTVRLTRHGPVVDDVDRFDEPEGYVLAMRWTAPELGTVPLALYAFNRAETIDDMEKGIEYFKCPGQNIVYADDQGNIGYWAAVGIPKREGFSGHGAPPGMGGKIRVERVRTHGASSPTSGIPRGDGSPRQTTSTSARNPPILFPTTMPCRTATSALPRC